MQVVIVQWVQVQTNVRVIVECVRFGSGVNELRSGRGNFAKLFRRMFIVGSFLFSMCSLVSQKVKIPIWLVHAPWVLANVHLPTVRVWTRSRHLCHVWRLARTFDHVVALPRRCVSRKKATGWLVSGRIARISSDNGCDKLWSLLRLSFGWTLILFGILSFYKTSIRISSKC